MVSSMQCLLDTLAAAGADAMISGDAGSPSVLRFGEKRMLWLRLTAAGRSSQAAHVDRLQRGRSLRQRPLRGTLRYGDARPALLI